MYLPILIPVLWLSAVLVLDLMGVFFVPIGLVFWVAVLLFAVVLWRSIVGYRRGCFAEACAKRSGSRTDRYRAYVLLNRIRFRTDF